MGFCYKRNTVRLTIALTMFFFFLKKERNKEKNCLSCFALHALFSFRADQRNPERELCRVCLFSLCEQLSASMGWT